MARKDGRAANALRPISLEVDVSRYAEGSCRVRFGHTEVLCLASVEDRVPAFLKGSGKGWVTAEYGMLPRATNTRVEREAVAGRQSGRSQEIQRLIGRALRAAVNLSGFGERSIKIDCDVLQADGGTRTAAITGGFVALMLALQHLKAVGAISALPLVTEVAAVSCGIVQGEARLDLDYAEDSKAEVDANFVVTGDGRIVEVQGTAEGAPFSRAAFEAMLSLGEAGCATLVRQQRAALGLPG